MVLHNQLNVCIVDEHSKNEFSEPIRILGFTKKLVQTKIILCTH
jgi:hypothetical protein